ncbi:MAG: hypothetical protein H6727_00075 [Myxococcales bacterium]|nr:hypothetical protein [Myxococcales bacterium]
MSIQFGSINPAQVAQAFMNMSTQGASGAASGGGGLMNAVQGAANMMQGIMGGASAFAAGGAFAFGGGFGFGAAGAASGFLTPPNQSSVQNGFAQMMGGGLAGLNQGWNSMGNMLSGALGMGGGLSGMMGQMMNSMKMIGGMLNMVGGLMKMAQQLKAAANPATTGKPQMPSIQNMPGAQPGAGANFPGKVGSDFLSKLPGNKDAVARQLNVSGRSDVNHINNAVGKLKTAKPTLTPAQEGQKPGKAQLQLSQADVDAIRNAPTDKAAKELVMKAIAKQTGVKVGDINMNDKKGIRNDNNRQALNKLLGTNVRRGTEKNSGSSLTLDTIAESVAKSVRGGDFGSTQVQTPGQLVVAGGAWGGAAAGAFGGGFGQVGEEGAFGGGFGGAFGGAWGGAALGAFFIPGQTQEIPNPSSGLNVDLGSFSGAANEVAKLASPLIFDLEGTGLDLKGGGMIEVDIDGDGKAEMITDIDAELGLLVFDSKGDGLEDITGADMFGDNTDLTKYGIQGATEDGKFKDGFQALRALCEHFKLVNDSKQFLDQGDLAFLEEEVGLRMRVGGVVSGDDRRFSEIGVTEINLGNPAQTQHIDDAKEDRWGNKLMLQDGATFTVYTEVRKYADIWFKIQARYEDSVAKPDLQAFSKAQLMNLR